MSSITEFGDNDRSLSESSDPRNTIKSLPPKNIARLQKPNPNYWKSKEGVAEFKKYGLGYPDTAWDKHYEKFLKRTPEKGNDFKHRNKTRTTDIYRHMISGKEYLVWNQMEIRYTPLGNPEHKNRAGLGRYPIIEISNVMMQEDSGLKRILQEPTGATKTGYSLPYTVENIDKLHENAVDEYEDKDGEEVRLTRYYVYDGRKRTTISVPKWEDFRDGDFYQLYEYGQKVSSEEEAKAIKDRIEKERQQVEQQKLETLKRSV